MADVAGVTVVHRSLSPNAADRVTISTNCAALNVFNRGNSADIFARVDGVDPTVDGEGSFVIPRGMQRLFGMPNLEAPAIRLISANAVDYSVECT